MVDFVVAPSALFQTGMGALVALMATSLFQRWTPPRNDHRRKTPPPLPRAVTPPPVQQQVVGPALGMAAVTAQFNAANDSGRRVITDAKGRDVIERAPRHRQLMAHAKILEKFMAWMIAEGFSGWYTPALIYEAYQDFAWEFALEEIDYRGFLAYLAAQPGVQKKRAYVKKNETFRHLRGCTNGQERAVVYRIPTSAEMAALKHKASLAAAEARQGRPASGQHKVRLTPGGPKHPAVTPATRRAAETRSDFNAQDVAIGGYRMTG